MVSNLLLLFRYLEPLWNTLHFFCYERTWYSTLEEINAFTNHLSRCVALQNSIRAESFAIMYDRDARVCWTVQADFRWIAEKTLWTSLQCDATCWTQAARCLWFRRKSTSCVCERTGCLRCHSWAGGPWALRSPDPLVRVEACCCGWRTPAAGHG